MGNNATADRVEELEMSKSQGDQTEGIEGAQNDVTIVKEVPIAVKEHEEVTQRAQNADMENYKCRRKGNKRAKELVAAASCINKVETTPTCSQEVAPKRMLAKKKRKCQEVK
ncbi:hypothetical protein EMCRGX_G002948 [Ephydatia muelleri]